jgi:uncharacterized protein
MLICKYMEKLTQNFELKSYSEAATANGNFGYFTGYASTFNNVDEDNDVVVKGAFVKSLQKSKPKLLMGHDRQKLIGKFIECKEDDYGLFVEGRVNLDTQYGKEAYALLKAGDIDKMSIGYYVKQATVDPLSRARMLKELELSEISLVAIPANNAAVVTGVKSLDELSTLADCEGYLREKGLAKRESTAIVSCIKKFLKQSDSAEENKGVVREAQTASEGKNINDIKSFVGDLQILINQIKGVQHG